MSHPINRTINLRKTKSERRERKRRPRMAVSGRGVFVLQRLRARPSFHRPKP